MKVLVAEDDRASRHLLRVILRNWGYEVVVAENGREALDVLEGPDAPRLAILDWMMPDVDGLEVARRVRRAQRDEYVYLILLTAKSRKEDMLEGMNAGADDYLTKPLDSRELEVRLRAARRLLDLQAELIAARESLREQATHDPLTGLWNRRAILGLLLAEVDRSRREQTSVGIAMADLDHFKRVNDTHGHRSGDAVLGESARRMGQVMRPYDAVGRYGGEEFLIVVPRGDRRVVADVAERCRRAVSEAPFQVHGTSLSVTLSLGAAAMRDVPDPEGNTLIQAADRALYRAKAAGRNRLELAEGGPAAPGQLSTADRGIRSRP